MLSTSMAAMQNQIGILTQSVAQQQQAMLQPIAPIPAPLSPLNIPLPSSPPSPPHHPSPHMQGQYMFPPPIRTKEPKIAAPLHFTSKRDETKSFINSCTLYMNGQKSEFPDEDAKIYWILSYMTLSTAKTWRDYVVSLMYWQQHNFPSGDELLQEINQKFGDMDKRTTQLLKIRTMQQGDKPTDEHVQDFEKAVLEAGYDGYPLVVEFKRSLNQGLRRRLTELRPGPVTIEQWYNEVIRMDHQWRITKAEEAFYSKVNQSALRKPPHNSQDHRCHRLRWDRPSGTCCSHIGSSNSSNNKHHHCVIPMQWMLTEIWDARKYLDKQEAAAKDAKEIKKKEDFSAATKWSRSHLSCKTSFIN